MYRKDQEYVSNVRSRLFASQSPNVNLLCPSSSFLENVEELATRPVAIEVFTLISLCACTGYAVKMLHTLKIGEEPLLGTVNSSELHSYCSLVNSRRIPRKVEIF